MWETSAEVDRFIHGRRRPPDRAFHKQISPKRTAQTLFVDMSQNVNPRASRAQ
jgi:hypothetical protein